MVTIMIQFDPAEKAYRREEKFVLGNIIRSLASHVDLWRADGAQVISIMDDDSLEIGSMTIRAADDRTVAVLEEEVKIVTRNLIAQHKLPAVCSALSAVVDETISGWRGSSAKTKASEWLGQCRTHLELALVDAQAAEDVPSGNGKD